MGEDTMDQVRPRVLIIAANPTLRFALEELLHAYDYDITSAANSEVAAALAAHQPLEAVLVALGENELGTARPIPTKLDNPAAYWPQLEYILT